MQLLGFFGWLLARQPALGPGTTICGSFPNGCYFLTPPPPTPGIYLVTNPTNGAGGRLRSTCRRGPRRWPGPFLPAGFQGSSKPALHPTAMERRNRPGQQRPETRIDVYSEKESRGKKGGLYRGFYCTIQKCHPLFLPPLLFFFFFLKCRYISQTKSQFFFPGGPRRGTGKEGRGRARSRVTRDDD